MDAVLLLAIEEIAKQSGFAEEYIKERGEYMASSGIGAFFGGSSNAKKLYRTLVPIDGFLPSLH